MMPLPALFSVQFQTRSRAFAWASSLAVLGLAVATGCERGDASGTVAADVKPAAAARSTTQPAPAATGTVTPPANVAGETRAEYPPVEFDPPIVNLGYIKPDTDLKPAVKIWNRGTEPLTITLSQPDCKCTVVQDLAGTVIQPNTFYEFVAHIDGRSSPGPRVSKVRFLFEDYSQVTEISFQGEIVMPVRAVPQYINALSPEPMHGRVEVTSLDNKPFTVLRADGMAPRFVDYDPDFDELRSRYVLEYNLANTPHEMRKWWVVETDREDCPLLDVEVRHEKVRVERGMQDQTWFVATQRVLAGVVNDTEEHEIAITLERDKALIAHGATPPHEQLQAGMRLAMIQPLNDLVQSIRIVKVEGDGPRVYVTAAFTVKKGFRGLLYCPMRVLSTHPQYNRQMWLYARVVD